MQNENKEQTPSHQYVGNILTIIQSEEFTTKIATKVYDQFAEVYGQIQVSLEQLHEGQQKNIEGITYIKEKLEKVKNKEAELEEKFDLLAGHVDDIHDMIPDNFKDEFWQMKTKINELKWVPSKKTIKRRVILTALAAVIITLLVVFLLLPWFHNHFLAEINYRSNDTIEWTKELHEGQARDKGTTRGGYVNDSIPDESIIKK